MFKLYQDQYADFATRLRYLDVSPNEAFFRSRNLEGILEVQKKVYFPNLFEKIWTRTSIINGQKLFSKSASFGEYQIHLGKHCVVDFGKELKLFYQMKKLGKSPLDKCLEEYVLGSTTHRNQKGAYYISRLVYTNMGDIISGITSVL